MESSIVTTREMSTVLPKKVSITYFDPAREYEVNEQYAEKLGTGTVNTQQLELPIVLSATEAAQKAEMLLSLYWMERYDVEFTLPPTFNNLEPGDVITINATEATYEIRLTQIEYGSNGVLKCKGKFNNSATYTPVAVGEDSSFTDQVLGVAGPTVFQVLDIPCILDTMDKPGYVIAASGYSAWPGGVVLRSDDSGQTWVTVAGFTKPGKKIGMVANVPAITNTVMIDNCGYIEVNLVQGSLSSVTELALMNGANYFAYGVDGRWEIIAARTCTLQASGSYILTDLLRGRFGTERNTGNHAIGDYLISLDTRSTFVTVNSSLIGLSRDFIGVTNGFSIEDQTMQNYKYNAVNLECLSPVYLRGSKHPTTGDWTLDWIRRTRVGGEWRDLVDATLGEMTESYQIEIYSSSAYTTLKRTLTSTTPTVTYLGTQQTTDFGSFQTTLYVKIYQVSSVMSTGFPLTKTLVG